MREPEDTGRTTLEGWYQRTDVRYVTAIAIMLTLIPVIVTILTIILLPDTSGSSLVYIITFLLLLPLLIALPAWLYRRNYRGFRVDAGYKRSFFVRDAKTVPEEIERRLPQTVRPWSIVHRKDPDDEAHIISTTVLTLGEEDGVTLCIFLNVRRDTGHLAIEVTSSDRGSQATRDLLKSLTDVMKDLVKPWPPADLENERLKVNEGVVKGWSNMGWAIKHIRWNGYLGLVILVELMIILALILFVPPRYEPEMVFINMWFVLTLQILWPVMMLVVEQISYLYREDVLIVYKNVYPLGPAYVTEAIEEGLTKKGRKFERRRHVDPETLLPCERFDLTDMEGARVSIDVSREEAGKDGELTGVFIRTSRMISDIRWTQILIHGAVYP